MICSMLSSSWFDYSLQIGIYKCKLTLKLLLYTEVVTLRSQKNLRSKLYFVYLSFSFETMTNNTVNHLLFTMLLFRYFLMFNLLVSKRIGTGHKYGHSDMYLTPYIHKVLHSQCTSFENNSINKKLANIQWFTVTEKI